MSQPDAREPAVACALEPGLTLCAACRTRDAVLVEDPGERWQRPLCFECADDVLDGSSHRLSVSWRARLWDRYCMLRGHEADAGARARFAFLRSLGYRRATS